MKKSVTLTVSFKNDFIPFLENHQACEDYVNSALAHYKGSTGKEVRDAILGNLRNPELWVSGVFVWTDSSKGQTFWSSLNDLWHTFLEDEAGTRDFKTIGEVSESDVKFLLEPLRGQYYRVTDLSYNRPVTNEWDKREWKTCSISTELHETGGIYLILSDYPESKVMLWHGPDATPRPMIKVWVPELDRAQWVFYQKSGLQKTE